MTVRDEYPERAPKTRNRDRRGVEIGRAPPTLLTTLPGSCGAPGPKARFAPPGRPARRRSPFPCAVVAEEAHCLSELGRPAWSEPSPSGLSLAISAASSTGRTPARSSARRPSRNRELSCGKFGPTLSATLLAELSELEYLDRDRPVRYPALGAGADMTAVPSSRATTAVRTRPTKRPCSRAPGMSFISVPSDAGSAIEGNRQSTV